MRIIKVKEYYYELLCEINYIVSKFPHLESSLINISTYFANPKILIGYLISVLIMSWCYKFLDNFEIEF